MNKLNEILQKIAASVQVVLDGTLNLAFQPLFYLLAIIEGIIEVWTVDEDEAEEEIDEKPKQNVTTYSSPNDGRMGPEEEWDCDYPIGHIGFRQNHKTE